MSPQAHLMAGETGHPRWRRGGPHPSPTPVPPLGLCTRRWPLRDIWQHNGSPLQYSSLENSVDRGAWWATVHVVTKELDMTALAPHERLLEILVVPREKTPTGAAARGNPGDAPVLAS